MQQPLRIAFLVLVTGKRDTEGVNVKGHECCSLLLYYLKRPGYWRIMALLIISAITSAS